MPANKKNEILTLGLTLAITGGLLLGGFWLASKSSLIAKLNDADTESVKTKAQPQVQVTLDVLGDTFSGYSTLRSSAFEGSLIERGVGINYANEFDQQLRVQALDQGKADLIVTTLDQFITHQPQGKIVALIDRTVGADAIVLNSKRYPQLKSLLDLERLVQQQQGRGKQLKIVFAGDTPSEFLVTVLDTKFDNFNLADFEVIEVADASVAWEKMQQDPEVAIAVLWEPFVSAAKQEGNTVVLSSADAPKVIVDVIVASDRLLQNNPGAVQQLVEAYYRRLDSSVQDQNLLIRQIAVDGNLDPSEAKTVAEGIKFFTSVEAQSWMDSGLLEQRIEAIAAILALSGRIDAIPSNAQNLFTAEYLAPIATQTSKMIAAIAADDPELAAKLTGNSGAVAVKPVSVTQVQQAEPIGNLTVRGEVSFATGSAQLTLQGKETLDQLVDEIEEFSANNVGIKIQGHTSRTGTTAFNQQLSQARANVVASYLQGRNLHHRFLAEGLGFSQPLPGVSPDSPLNQRTVIRLVRIGS